MSNDVTTDRLLGVDCMCHGSAWVRHHLVAHEDCHVELLADLLDPVEELAEHLLSLRELASSGEVYSEGSHDRIDDKE